MEIQINKEVQLGEGGFGSVFQGMFQNRKVAVKIVHLKDANGNEEVALQQLDHPNIVKLFHVECHNNTKYFAFELCDASLDQIFLRPSHPRKYKGPKLPHDFEIFSQLASGLEYIHSKNLVHQDIKPGNVLISVDSTGQEVKVTMKWADFGLSRSVNEQGTFSMKKIGGTSCWCAPEVLKLLFQLRLSKTMGKPRGTVKSDVFAMGLVFAFLLSGGRHIYGTGSYYGINNSILKGKIKNIIKFEPSHYAHNLIQKMLKNLPEDRISSSDVVEELKSIQIQLAEKEKEMLQLSEIRNQAESRVSPWTNQTKQFGILIRQGVNINTKNSNGRSALHLVCANNSSEILTDAIKLLIRGGIDVNGKDNDGRNALHLLCYNNSSESLIDAIELLIENGIDVNGKDKDGRNALHLLCRNNSSEGIIDAIELLIELRIEMNGEDKDGRNALHFWCRNNSSEKLSDTIELLIEGGIDVNGKDKDGRNALHLLCFNCSSEGLIDAIELLIEGGIDVNGRDEDGRNALHFLCRNNSSEKFIEAVELLIQFGIDANMKSNNGCNALHFLCANSSCKRFIDAIKLLIQFGINVNWKNNNGSNALHFLCQLNSSESLIDAIKLLIQQGIEVNEKDKDGRNALHLLCANNKLTNGLIEAIQVLIQHGIDVTSNGFDARLILRENYVLKDNLDEIIEILDGASVRPT